MGYARGPGKPKPAPGANEPILVRPGWFACPACSRAVKDPAVTRLGASWCDRWSRWVRLTPLRLEHG